MQDGVLHLACGLPSWWVDPDRAAVKLTVPDGPVRKGKDYRFFGGHFLVWTYAADRLGDALAYQRGRRPDDEIDVQGAVDFIDPARALGTNLSDLAGLACGWLAEMVKYPIADLPAEMVRRWHEVAHGSTEAWNEEPGRAAEILECAVSFAEDMQAYPNAFRGRGSSIRAHTFWQGLLERLEVEGIRPHAPARPAMATLAGL